MFASLMQHKKYDKWKSPNQRCTGGIAPLHAISGLRSAQRCLELDPIRGNCMPDRSSSLGDHRMSRCLALDLGNSDLLLL